MVVLRLIVIQHYLTCDMRSLGRYMQTLGAPIAFDKHPCLVRSTSVALLQHSHDAFFAHLGYRSGSARMAVCARLHHLRIVMLAHRSFAYEFVEKGFVYQDRSIELRLYQLCRVRWFCSGELVCLASHCHGDVHVVVKLRRAGDPMGIKAINEHAWVLEARVLSDVISAGEDLLTKLTTSMAPYEPLFAVHHSVGS